MLISVWTKVEKSIFGVIIERYNSSSYRRKDFVGFSCEISGDYKKKNKKVKMQ